MWADPMESETRRIRWGKERMKERREEKTKQRLYRRQDSASNACATWVQNRITLAPYLCIGGRDGLIKMYDVIAGELVEV
jgi:hypothetical protein